MKHLTVTVPQQYLTHLSSRTWVQTRQKMCSQVCKLHTHTHTSRSAENTGFHCVAGVSTDASLASVRPCECVGVFRENGFCISALVSSSFPPSPSLLPLYPTFSPLLLFSFCTGGPSANPECIMLSAPLFVLFLCACAPLSPNICFH